MEILDIDDLHEKDFDRLYDFINKKDNISNKNIKNNLLWNIIYLRKAFRQSENYYKRSSKLKTSYNYIIFQDKEIKGIVVISADTRIPIKLFDLSIISNKIFLQQLIFSNTSQNIISNIIEKFNRNFNKENYLIKSYVDSNIDNINMLISSNGFILGCIDGKTFVNKNNIYYNFIINIPLAKNTKFNNAYLVGILMDYYGLNDIDDEINGEINGEININKRDKMESSSKIFKGTQTISKDKKTKNVKLTLKQLQSDTINIITKNIFDVEEILDLPEYNYDYYKMSFIKRMGIVYNLEKFNNVNEYIMKRYFKKPIIFNKSIYNLYEHNINYIKDKIKEYNYYANNVFFSNLVRNLIKYNAQSIIISYFLKEIEMKIISKFNKKLILTSSYETIEYLSVYKCDIITKRSYKTKFHS
jgi:hypothetical protein